MSETNTADTQVQREITYRCGHHGTLAVHPVFGSAQVAMEQLLDCPMCRERDLDGPEWVTFLPVTDEEHPANPMAELFGLRPGHVLKIRRDRLPTELRAADLVVVHACGHRTALQLLPAWFLRRPVDVLHTGLLARVGAYTVPPALCGACGGPEWTVEGWRALAEDQPPHRLDRADVAEVVWVPQPLDLSDPEAVLTSSAASLRDRERLLLYRDAKRVFPVFYAPPGGKGGVQ